MSITEKSVGANNTIVAGSLEGGVKWGNNCCWYKVSFGRDENALEAHSVMLPNSVSTLKSPELHF